MEEFVADPVAPEEGAERAQAPGDLSRLLLELAARRRLRSFSPQSTRRTLEHRRLDRVAVDALEDQPAVGEDGTTIAPNGRGDITLSEEERRCFCSGDTDQQLLSTSSAWSREFGTGEVIDQDSPGWCSFVQAIGWRNGVTHPQKLFDFILLPERIQRF